MELNLVYNIRSAETAKLINNFLRNTLHCSGVMARSDGQLVHRTTGRPTLTYGFNNTEFGRMGKKAQLKYLECVIDNTLITAQECTPYTTVVLKNPLRIMLFKDVESQYYNEMYRFIKNKTEWRINYSYGKVNTILFKDLCGNVFGKQNNCDWFIEQRPKVRKMLIDFTKSIAERSGINNFGLDVCYDKDNEMLYLLELNQANGLNELGVKRFLKAYFEKNYTQFYLANKLLFEGD